MALFVFFAQPLFVLAGLLFVRRVIRDLRDKDAL
jgi:hypothetical protein